MLIVKEIELLEMILSLKSKIESKFAQTNGRSQNVIKNILMSFGVKFGWVLVSLALVPMTINYISPVQYGIWLTISSIVNWTNFFDVGLGNGLRNKLANSLALNDYEKAKDYVSTTYAFLLIISTILLVLFCAVNPFVNWNRFLNVPQSFNENLHFVVLAVFASFCVQFVVQTINTVLTAYQEPAKAALISFLGQVGVLLAVLILKKTVPGKLSILVFVLTLIPIFVLFIASFFLYNGKLKNISPSFKHINFKSGKSILGVGSTFFIIQIGALILFQTDNLIVTRVIGPAAVTDFNVAYKLFSVVIMVFLIVMTPFWSAFTEAYAKKDFAWMKKSIKKLRVIWIMFSFVGVPILLVFSKWIFKIWVGNLTNISFSLSAAMACYVVCYTCLSLNCYFLNGVGKLRVQLILYTIVTVLNIPLGVYLGHRFGLIGVVYSNVAMFVFMNIILWIQSNRVLNNTIKGVWAK